MEACLLYRSNIVTLTNTNQFRIHVILTTAHNKNKNTTILIDSKKDDIRNILPVYFIKALTTA